MPLEEVLDIALQVATGLQEAHEKNIVHCDLNPSYILTTSKGLVKITDFGLALLLCGGESVPRKAIMATAAHIHQGKKEQNEGCMAPEVTRFVTATFFPAYSSVIRA